jgi:hypothetical protein
MSKTKFRSRTGVYRGVAAAVVLLSASHSYGWGDEGHEVVGLIAAHYLESAAAQQLNALLAQDSDALTAHDIASEATWADKFRDSDRNTTKVHYNQTHNWHFVDMELSHPDLGGACFGHPPLPAAKPASQGPPKDCVVDKIQEFSDELRATDTPPEERLEALKFLLHFVGDLHQPLHASDDHDAGGNQKRVSAKGFRAGNLHHYWDTEWVSRLGSDPHAVANALIAKISAQQVQQWSQGSASDWAQQSFEIARTTAYGNLPAPSARGSYRLSATYVSAAQQAVADQLSKAGVRLASVLNQAFASANPRVGQGSPQIPSRASAAARLPPEQERRSGER